MNKKQVAERECAAERRPVASVYYQHVEGTPLHIGWRRSAFLELLTHVLGTNSPWQLDDEMIERLAAAARRKATDPDHRRAIKELIDAIEQHGTIRVWEAIMI